MSVKLRPCLSDADRAICVLRLAAAKDSGDQVARDQDLAAHPELLAQIGVTPASIQDNRKTKDGQVAQMFFGPLDSSAEAAAQARALDKAGKPPQEALASVRALPLGGPPLPMFFGGQNSDSPRLLAYRRLIEETPPPSNPLIAAALAGWEEELARQVAAGDAYADPSALVWAYAAHQDEAGVDRALQLEDRPDARIDLLAELNRFEAAARDAIALKPSDVEPGMRRKLGRLRGIQGAYDAADAQATDQAIQEVLAKMTADGAAEADIAKMRRRFQRAMQAGEARMREMEARRDAEVEKSLKMETASRVSKVRYDLMRSAIRAGRPREVQALSNHLLMQTPPGKADYDFLGAAPTVLQTADPRLAVAWLTELERRTNLPGRMTTLIEGWSAMGRSDKVDELIAELRRAARAELGRSKSRPAAAELSAALIKLGRVDEARELGVARPDELLRAEITAGRGVDRLDEYLAKAGDEGKQVSLLVACSSESASKRRYDDVLRCSRRQYEVLVAPSQRMNLADQSIGYAGEAAEHDDLASSRALLDLAVTVGAAGLAADGALADRYESVGSTPLIQIAKAELRASDRLPPRPKAQTVIGRAP